MKRLLVCLLLCPILAVAGVTYRTDGAWGTGVHRPLTWGEMDTNFYDLATQGTFDTITITQGTAGTLTANQLIAKDPVVDVRAFGSAYTHAPIQAAIDSLDATKGGVVHIPHGTSDYIIGQSLMVIDKHNVTIECDPGTVLKATSQPLPDATRWNDSNLGYGGTIVYGIVTVDSTASTIATNPTSNVRVVGCTLDSSGYTATGNAKTAFVGAANDVEFDHVRVLGGNTEALYHHGHSYLGTTYVSNRVRVHHSYFGPTCAGEAVTNNGGGFAWQVDHNFFDQCQDMATHLIGDGQSFTDNLLYRVKARNVTIGEGLGTDNGNRANIVARNLLIEPGYGNESGPIGIYVIGNGATQAPRGVEVSRNIIHKLYAGAGGANAIQAEGPAVIDGNIISGVTGAGVANSAAVAVGTFSPSHDPAAVYHVTNNTLEDTTLPTHYAEGLLIANGTSTGNLTTVYSSGNYWGDDAGTRPHRLQVADNASGLYPNLYVHGDVIRGTALGRKGAWASGLNTDGRFDNVPLTINNVATGAAGLPFTDSGTWTPTLTFGGGSTGITYAAQSGTWVRAGNVITLTLDFTLTSKGSSTGTAAISGLPFSGKTGKTFYGTAAVEYLTNSAPKISVTGGSSSLGVLLGSANNPYTVGSDTAFANNTHLSVTLQYETD